MSTKTVLITKALTHRKKDHDDIDDLTIVVCGQLPEFDGLKEAAAFSQMEGQKLADALHECLPGATFDRVLAAMLQYKASFLKWPYSEVP